VGRLDGRWKPAWWAIGENKVDAEALVLVDVAPAARPLAGLLKIRTFMEA